MLTELLFSEPITFSELAFAALGAIILCSGGYFIYFFFVKGKVYRSKSANRLVLATALFLVAAAGILSCIQYWRGVLDLDSLTGVFW